MDGLTKIAVQSYKQSWSEAEKKKFDNFFKDLDSNRNKKVSFEELRKKDIISKDLLYVFNQLDTNNNRSLDFEEVLCLYYYKYIEAEVVKSYNPSARFCKGSLCPRLQKSPDFSCFLCLSKTLRRSYHLCSSCHEKGVHTRMHTQHPECMLINRQALDVLDKMKAMLFHEDQKHQELMKAASNIAITTVPGLLTSAAGGAACTIM